MTAMQFNGRRQNGFSALTMACLLLAAVGCDRQPKPPTIVVAEGPKMRIVSLSPALTQMVVDLGKGDWLVGVAPQDATAPKGVRVVGGTFQDPDREALLALKPTLLLTMQRPEQVPDSLKALAVGQGFKLVSYPPPANIQDITNTLFPPDDLTAGDKGKGLGAVLGNSFLGLQAANRLVVQLGNLDDLTKDRPRPRVLMVIGTQPTIMACGPGTVHDDILRHYAGGRNAAGEEKVGAPVFDKEKLLAANPDVILLLLPGERPLGAIEEDDRLADLRGLPITAVKEKRIVLINDPLVVLPSTSLPRIAAAMAKAIHPELSAAIDEAMRQDVLHPATRPSTPGSRPATVPTMAEVQPPALTSPSITPGFPSTAPDAGH
jgi:ABC-type Fe3+-hydroxamate transport system substrate-binding protein